MPGTYPGAPSRNCGGSGPSCHLVADLLREHEANVLVDRAQFGDVVGSPLPEELDERLDELFRSARPRSDADGRDILEPLLLDLRVVVDQVRCSSVLASHLDEAVR